MNVVIAVKPKLCFCFISAQAFNGTSKSNNSLENMGVCKNAADITTMNMYNMCIIRVARIPTLSPESTKKYDVAFGFVYIRAKANAKATSLGMDTQFSNVCVYIERWQRSKRILTFAFALI